ncbi:hypothetical protein [Pseudolysinimonas sp.]|uniref:hypothetical protein n=1 Tax=Pseudolysinimonas sp. TaxID=2680009 RepID=UPI003F7F9A38
MSDTRLYRRLGRRLTHRSRSVAASVALVLVALAAVAIAIEAALRLLDRPALVARPDRIVAALASGSPWAVLAGAVAAVLGIAAILVAVIPGRRPRRVVQREDLLVVIDDDVLASSLSRAAASGASIPRDQVRTVLGRRVARVRVQPSSGFPLTADEPLRRVTEVLDTAQARPALRPRVEVSTEGRLR